MGAATSEGDALNGGSTDGARLAGAHVDAVFELEKATDALGVDIVGDRRAAQLDGVLEDFD